MLSMVNKNIFLPNKNVIFVSDLVYKIINKICFVAGLLLILILQDKGPWISLCLSLFMRYKQIILIHVPV